MDSLSFLDSPPSGKPRRLYILHGDEDFLKRRVLQAIKERVLGPDGDSFGLSTNAGDKAAFAAVYDELQTVPFFGPRRLVIVENADPFITRYRDLLEKVIGDLPETGVLVLEVKSWPSNTRLYKMVDAASAIGCKAPPAYKLPPWCVQWAASQYGKKLAADGAALLVDLIGADMGQLDQELLKLAVYVGNKGRIDTADVDQLVGRSRTENTFKIFDAIGQGNAREALGMLDRLFAQGEEPMRILAAFSMQLRRLAQAARLYGQGRPLAVALEEAGVAAFAAKGCEQQMRHLGRRRLERLYDWLLEVDQGVKGGSQLPPRTLLERLVVRLARKN
ncbi:MAG TPA: DNA polymerase III subunit delta [Gemmataceae bacterium]|nr:DNA polymerase III subunit delta [Gemmataceae bacterium]